jgi:hypothetical protein
VQVWTSRLNFDLCPNPKKHIFIKIHIRAGPYTLLRSQELDVLEVYLIEHFSRSSSGPWQSMLSVILRSKLTGPWIKPWNKMTSTVYAWLLSAWLVETWHATLKNTLISRVAWKSWLKLHFRHGFFQGSAVQISSSLNLTMYVERNNLKNW